MTECEQKGNKKGTVKETDTQGMIRGEERPKGYERSGRDTRRQGLKRREESVFRREVSRARPARKVTVYRVSSGFSSKDVNGTHLWKSLQWRVEMKPGGTRWLWLEVNMGSRKGCHVSQEVLPAFTASPCCPTKEK